VVWGGAGAAPRGPAPPLARAGVPEIRVVNRTAEKADQLAVDLMMEFDTNVVRADFAGTLEDAGLLINAATAGLGGKDERDLDLTGAPSDMVVMDMVYSPLITPLLAMARARGLVIVDGLEMLIGQAIPSFEALFGRPPPKDVDVRSLALEELGRRG
jgi:shikimate dehydrogenase